ncbi:MAG TPA: hypothetical protein VK463_14145 [Desulfomonilaceae bacterium]|nr:hypothetical protein [Desulfomonilaceae bacterium]
MNFSRKIWVFAGLALAVCLMTVPRLLINYGMDGDAIRGMLAGRNLVSTGMYIPSRLPGNPTFEYFLAVVSFIDGHVVANVLILAFYGLCIAAFRVLSKDYEHDLLLLALFALTPILLVNAVAAKDYVPGLALLLWSYVCARKGQYLSGYLLLGLAIGFRLPNVLFAIPLGFFLYLRKRTVPEILFLSGISVLMGGLAYAPIYLESGTSMLEIPGHSYQGISYLFFTGYRLLMVFGPVATAGICVLLAMNSRKIGRVTRESFLSGDPEYCLEFTSVIGFFLLFLRHSDKSEYLIPVIPFFYLLVWRWLNYKEVVCLSILVVSFAFVSLELKGGESGRRAVGFKPEWGIVVKDFQDRRELEALRDGVDMFDHSRKTVILHGYGPVLGFDNNKLARADYREIDPALDAEGITESNYIHRLRTGPVFFVSGLSEKNVRLLQQKGFAVYFFSESAPSLCMYVHRYDPAALGLPRLDILNEHAFYRKKVRGL